MKKVAVIIVNYNGLKYLPDLFGSLFKFPPESVSQEILVIDNNSTDNSISWLKEHYPEVKILQQSENLGFAQANNLGMQYAIDQNFDYVFLLNQDTLIEKGCLDSLAAQIEESDKYGAVQPRIMLHPQTELVNSLGNRIHFLGFGYTYGHKHRFEELSLTDNQVDYCSGAAVLFKTEVLKKVGLFDPELFMYHEDLDLGWRLSLNGWDNLVCDQAVIYHKYEFSRSIKKYYFMERNRFKVIFQNYKLGTILLLLPALIIMEIGLLATSVKNGFLREKIRGYLYLLNPVNIVKILSKRKEIQSQRSRPDYEIVKRFSGKIEHQEINNPVIEKLINPLFNFYWRIVKKMIIW